MTTPLLDIKNLRVTFQKEGQLIKAVDGLSLTIHEGEVFGLIGESGSGKSVTGLSIMRLLDESAKIESTWIKLKDQDLFSLSEKEMRKVRGNKISMIFQDPMTSLNPSIPIGRQIEESLVVHLRMSMEKSKARVCELMEMVSIPDPKMSSKRYPHEFSGGMRQRVMIAMALCCNPLLLIADEPTTALDVTIQAQILELIKNLVSKLGTSIFIISHDFGVITELCDNVSVIYGGSIVERAPIEVILKKPKHPYTVGLLNCVISTEEKVGRLEMIPGLPPDPKNFPSGCKFHPRCKQSKKICSKEIPILREIDPGHFVSCFLYGCT
jgi:oligopeptide/dipeptide ABC transporter ATP-binding protein